MLSSLCADQVLVKRLLSFLLIVIATTIGAQTNFETFEVDLVTSTSEPILEDINGDGLTDLIIPRYDRVNGRELHIHRQIKGATFVTEPQRIEVKSEIVAFAIADTRNDPGQEILWITADSFFSFSANIDGYTDNVKHVADWDLVIPKPDSRNLLFLPLSDINGDSRLDVLLPGYSANGVFLNIADDTFKKVAELNFPETSESDTKFEQNRSVSWKAQFSASRGLSFSTKVDIDSRYGRWIKVWLKNDNFRTLSHSSHWNPAPQLADFNGDGKLDVFYLSKNILYVYVQDDYDLWGLEPTYQQALKQTTFQRSQQDFVSPGGGLTLQDIDDDGDVDLIHTRMGFRNGTVTFFRNSGGSFDFETPDQVMRISGSDMVLNFFQMPGYDRPVMAINIYSIPLAKVLSKVEIKRKLHLYAPTHDAGKVFESSPASSWVDSFRTDSMKHLLDNTVGYDIDGDNHPDLVSVATTGELSARTLDTSLAIGDEQVWRYMPERTITGFHFADLNSDDVLDVIIQHSESTLYLMSTR